MHANDAPPAWHYQRRAHGMSPNIFYPVQGPEDARGDGAVPDEEDPQKEERDPQQKDPEQMEMEKSAIIDKFDLILTKVVYVIANLPDHENATFLKTYVDRLAYRIHEYVLMLSQASSINGDLNFEGRKPHCQADLEEFRQDYKFAKKRYDFIIGTSTSPSPPRSRTLSPWSGSNKSWEEDAQEEALMQEEAEAREKAKATEKPPKKEGPTKKGKHNLRKKKESTTTPKKHEHQLPKKEGQTEKVRPTKRQALKRKRWRKGTLCKKPPAEHATGPQHAQREAAASSSNFDELTRAEGRNCAGPATSACSNQLLAVDASMVL